jgi:hypothetical protein
MTVRELLCYERNPDPEAGKLFLEWGMGAGRKENDGGVKFNYDIFDIFYKLL